MPLVFENDYLECLNFSFQVIQAFIKFEAKSKSTENARLRLVFFTQNLTI